MSNMSLTQNRVKKVPFSIAHDPNVWVMKQASHSIKGVQGES